MTDGNSEFIFFILMLVIYLFVGLMQYDLLFILDDLVAGD
jgi:hypothetical protein